MAKHYLLLLFPLLSTILLLTVTESEAYSKTLSFQEPKPQKLTHLHFYFHDVITGDKPTAVRVAQSPTTNSSATAFGFIVIADDRLTEGPDPSSKEVGRAQGMFAGTDMKTISLTMVFNFLFTEGEFKGSTFSMYGRNPIFLKAREMPIIGGTGSFRFARGYAQAKTYKIDGSNAVVEYNVFIQH